jgi:hypothetical protein
VCLEKKYHIPALSKTVRSNAQSLNVDESRSDREVAYANILSLKLPRPYYFLGKKSLSPGFSFISVASPF